MNANPFASLPLDLQDLAEVIDNTITFCGDITEARLEWQAENRRVTVIVSAP